MKKQFYNEKNETYKSKYIDELVKQKNELNQIITIKETDIKDLTEQNNRLKKEIEELREELRRYRQADNDRDQTIEMLSQNLKQTDTENQRLNALNKEIFLKIEQQNEKIKDLEQQNQILLEENQILKDNLFKYTKEIQEIDKLRIQLQKLQEEYSQKLTDRDLEIADLNQKIENLHKEYQQLIQTLVSEKVEQYKCKVKTFLIKAFHEFELLSKRVKTQIIQKKGNIKKNLEDFNLRVQLDSNDLLGCQYENITEAKSPLHRQLTRQQTKVQRGSPALERTNTSASKQLLNRSMTIKNTDLSQINDETDVKKQVFFDNAETHIMSLQSKTDYEYELLSRRLIELVNDYLQQIKIDLERFINNSTEEADLQIQIQPRDFSSKSPLKKLLSKQLTVVRSGSSDDQKNGEKKIIQASKSIYVTQPSIKVNSAQKEKGWKI